MGFGVNNNKIGNKAEGGPISSLYYLFIFFMFVLVPTSTNGKLPQLSETIVNWAILSITILFCMKFFSKTNRNQLMIVVLVMAFMMVITVISDSYTPSGRFSLARLAPILCFFAMSVVSIQKIISIKLVKFMIHFFMGIFVVWNYLIISGDSSIQIFTISNYSQLYQDATSNMFIKNRPVMSFGIYTFASYFYFIFFLICRSLLKLTHNRIYLLYLILILVGNILLVSNTAFIFSLIMAYYIFFSFDSKRSKAVFLLFIISAAFYVLSDLTLVEYYLESFYSKGNGFRGRYLETGTLNSNWNYLQDNFYIGFNIIDNLTYSDSGYVLYYTMGGPIFLIAMYYCFYKFSKNNFSTDYLLFLIPTLVFEFSLPVMIYYKFIYASLFFALSFKSIKFHSNLNNQI